ncbi:mechanosensitive ion channel family protein [Coraliomargarita sp. SDUM461004]|uniref:Mechanosensitive ion channel family protein n=1 Tax=Thalassobacterium sedimentorum TaxID=3041258 RepID=A0ABU1AJ27_9BACT|nr:mechanosensitive ion channel family protein [Coraliomargarita sp. SDUM461004]MDQ8194825.1 mechanosensitive ion channel family protein [Coraliomargarita sp. SDUM461004]
MKPLDFNTVLFALTVLCIGLGLVFAISRLLTRVLKPRFSPHHLLLAQKSCLYVGIVLVICTTLIQLHVNLTAVLGAAGIVTVAIGFAAQTSLSNLISGLFLLGERPFEVGDTIIVGGTRGVVLSIDLLSVKLRTVDNLFVRMPNETLIKAEVTTVTRFPIRRMDINIGVAYKEDVKKVIRVLREVADANPHSLNEPVPLVLFKDFGASSLDFLLGVWFEKSKFLDLKNGIMQDIKERFDAEGIEIAFPHLTVYAGSETPAFPVTVTKETDELKK